MPKQEVKVPKQKVPFSLGLPDESKGPRRKRTSPPKEKEPSTIVNIKQPIAGRRKGEPVPPPPHTPLKPAPRRSPTLKWHKKGR